MPPDAPTNAGKHVTSNIACARTQRHTQYLVIWKAQMVCVVSLRSFLHFVILDGPTNGPSIRQLLTRTRRDGLLTCLFEIYIQYNSWYNMTIYDNFKNKIILFSYNFGSLLLLLDVERFLYIVKNVSFPFISFIKRNISTKASKSIKQRTSNCQLNTFREPNSIG